MERGKANGVQRLRIVEKKELFEMEPNLNPNVIAALYSPDAGNEDPSIRRKAIDERYQGPAVNSISSWAVELLSHECVTK